MPRRGLTRRVPTGHGPTRPDGRRSAARRVRTLLGLTGVGLAVAVMSAGAALAYWQSTDSSHPGAALAASLTAPTGGASGTATPTSIAISWTTPAGYTPTGYTVLRCTGSSCTPSTPVASGGCGGTITATSCTDTDPALSGGTTYSYAVTASLDLWVSPASTAFQAATSPAATLFFTTQPAAGASIQATGTGSFAVSVAVQDAHGSTEASDNTDTVTLAIGTNAGGGVLTCTNGGGLTVTVSSGVAVFTGCAISKAGTGYTLTASSATSPALTAPANANSFNIVAGAARKLVFTTAALVGSSSATAVLGPAAVQQQDADGNPVNAGAGGLSVGVSALPAGPVFAATSGGTSVTSVTIPSGSSSISFFFGSSAAGSFVTTAAHAGLTSATQTETVGADKLVIITAAVTGTATASPNIGPVTVQLQNAAGTPITTGATVSLLSNSAGIHQFAATSGGTSVTSVTISPGSSTASIFYGDELAGTPTITASGTGVTSATQQETISAGPAAGLSFSNVSTLLGPVPFSCAGTVGSASYVCTTSSLLTLVTMTANVILIDQFQNVVVNTSGSAITVSLTQTGGTSVSPGSLTIANGSSTSAATFSEVLGLLAAHVTATATVNSASVQGQLAN